VLGGVAIVTGRAGGDAVADLLFRIAGAAVALFLAFAVFRPRRAGRS